VIKQVYQVLMIATVAAYLFSYIWLKEKFKKFRKKG
jgi:hypothetical protein